MHPTGKAVLSLSEASKGEEAKLAGIASEELGIPPEDIKVKHEDTDRFGEGNSFSNGPSDVVGENVAITARKLRDKARIVAARCSRPRPTRFLRQRPLGGGGRSGGRQDPGRCLHTFGGFELPDGVEGSLDAQTTYRVEAVQATG